MRLGVIGISVLAALLSAAGPGRAQAPPPAPPSPPGFVSSYEIVHTLRAAGFDPLAPPLREGTIYVARATDYRGILMRVVLDARTGAIRDANRIVPGPGNYGGPYYGPYGEADDPYGPPYGRSLSGPPDLYGPWPYGADVDEGPPPPPYDRPPPSPYDRPLPSPYERPSAAAMPAFPPPLHASTGMRAPPLPRPRPPELASRHPVDIAKPAPAIDSKPATASGSKPAVKPAAPPAAPPAAAAQAAPAKPGTSPALTINN